MASSWSRPCPNFSPRSEEHTSELQSQSNLVCRLLLEKKKNKAFLPNKMIVIDVHVGPRPSVSAATAPFPQARAVPTIDIHPIPRLDRVSAARAWHEIA